jgi:hypothetical protein
MLQHTHTRQLLAVSVMLTLSSSGASPAQPESKQDSIELVGSVDLHGRYVQEIRLAGDAALLADYSPQTPWNANSLSIVSLVDTDNHHRVKRTFENVTALAQDDRRGLIYLVDHDGLKILRKVFSLNPEVEREFEKRLMYDR